MPRTPEPEIISVRIPSRLELLGILDRVAVSICEVCEFDEEACAQISMSVIEAGTNAIQHGHQRDAAKLVDVEFRIHEDELEIRVHDDGPGFDLSRITGDVTSPEHLFDARGRGIFIMKACMDRVEFDFGPAGTWCRLYKARSRKAVNA